MMNHGTGYQETEVLLDVLDSIDAMDSTQEAPDLSAARAKIEDMVSSEIQTLAAAALILHNLCTGGDEQED